MIYKKIDISQAAFYNVSEDAAKEFIDHRINIKKPLTQRAFIRAMIKAIECERDIGVTADEAIELTVDAGWQGISAEFILAQKSRKMSALQEARSLAAPKLKQTRDRSMIEDLTDRSWAN